ncbi:MAG TPA: hypothetical protein VF250_02775, partial [Conexibacter sp.]
MRRALREIHDRDAFRHSPVYGDLARYHVAFDDLVGGQAVESTLRHWTARRGKVALIAHSGGGKSSTL